MHFGEKDASIPMNDVDAVRAAQPKAEIYVYEGAGHGFGCDERGSSASRTTSSRSSGRWSFSSGTWAEVSIAGLDGSAAAARQQGRPILPLRIRLARVFGTHSALILA